MYKTVAYRLVNSDIARQKQKILEKGLYSTLTLRQCRAA